MNYSKFDLDCVYVMNHLVGLLVQAEEYTGAFRSDKSLILFTSYKKGIYVFKVYITSSIVDFYDKVLQELVNRGIICKKETESKKILGLF